MPIREANLSLRTFISSFSWFFCCWIDGSNLKSKGTSRLGFTVTLGMVPVGRQPVRLQELKLGRGAPQLSHFKVPGRELPAGVTSQLLRLLKPTTQERQAILGPRGPWEQGGCRDERGRLRGVTRAAGSSHRQGKPGTEEQTPVVQCSLAPGGRDSFQPDQPVR